MNEASFLDQHLRLPIITVHFELACSLAGVLRVSSQKILHISPFMSAIRPIAPRRWSLKVDSKLGNMQSNRRDTIHHIRKMVSKRNERLPFS